MTKAGNIISALFLFIIGVIFAYYSYPFFQSLLGALDGATGTAFEGWSDIKSILWIGYLAVMGAWILVLPAYMIFVTDEPVI